MPADVLYPDFAGKTKHYTKQTTEPEPIIYLTEQDVESIGLMVAEEALKPTEKDVS